MKNYLCFEKKNSIYYLFFLYPYLVVKGTLIFMTELKHNVNVNKANYVIKSLSAFCLISPALTFTSKGHKSSCQLENLLSVAKVASVSYCRQCCITTSLLLF